MTNTCFVLSEGELSFAVDTVFIATHTFDGRSVTLCHLDRTDNPRLDLVTIDRGPEQQIIIAISVIGLCCQQDREFGTTDCLHVTQGCPFILAVGMVFVESVAVDVDPNAHIWKAIRAHGGDGVVVA